MSTKSETESLIHSLKSQIETAREKGDHQCVIDAAKQVLEVASRHPGLRIAEFIFLRKIAKAYAKIGDDKNSLLYFKKSLDAAKNLENKGAVDIAKEIVALEHRIKHLEDNLGEDLG